MGLLQKACKTYDCFGGLAGVYEANKIVLAPVSHKVVSAEIEITIDADGIFISARAVGKDEPKIVIPVTEESAGRTSGNCPHPLCDNLHYVSNLNSSKHELYLQRLTDWESSEYSTPKLTAIRAYVEGDTIINDLIDAGIIHFEKGTLKEEKQIVRWIVNGLEEESGPCWTDKSLFESFILFYKRKKEYDDKVLCMVSGNVTTKASQHLKGIIANHGNAKLISSNDEDGFTYRGRFIEDSQALTIGYEASQKSHNILQWLVANQGVSYGGRTFVCWNPQGFELPKIDSPFSRGETKSVKYLTDYKKKLRDTLNGWKNDLPKEAGVVIASFDAATIGRLSLSYYNELQVSDFLQRLYQWDETCCWENGMYGIQSPSLHQIVKFAFGIERNGKFIVDKDIQGQHMQRIIANRIDGAKMPFDIEKNLVNKCSRMGHYDNKLRRELLFVTCAVIKKYQSDNMGRKWTMALDEGCRDRSYLFGRLLAIADSVERSTYDNDDKRETNAMRLQSSFALRPLTTWRTLEERLKPYYARVSSKNPKLRGYFQKTVQEIASMIEYNDPKLNTKLDDVYLLGYYHQKAYRKETTQTEEEK